MRFDLADLRLFLAVAEAGSITGGAAEAGLSLAAASERLRDMEAEGGVRLLDRGRRGVMLTEAGAALAHHARIILRQMTQMRGELGQYATGLRETVRILANTAAHTELLPPRLAPWMARNPRIDVELKERQSVEVAKALSRGLADVGIFSDAVDTAGLALHPFAVDRLAVVVSRDHVLSARKYVLLRDIVGERCVGLIDGALQEHIEAQAAKLGAKLKMRIRMRTFEGICQMVASGVGYGIIPETAARRHLRSGRIAIIRLSDDWATRRLVVGVSAETSLTAPLLELLGHLTHGANYKAPRQNFTAPDCSGGQAAERSCNPTAER
ncbi:MULTISPECIES: LysR family transcriptional regulator [unclassified Chelatococcus]|uniref:LysR family transcriptional regulator n=1 Tax=unclassified Chelatococcus TaxID=2638111 RepID=UPI001BCDA8D9|nr:MULTISPECIES: LysR family transcriptional regulator [unclassified Chelatococcus]MBS7700714.1 LysR family transcriptional regulator [Chelatococcus sp. YT9]MBX3559298.1 LysR family transcriptional regulator [Chelatococcus sp.]